MVIVALVTFGMLTPSTCHWYFIAGEPKTRVVKVVFEPAKTNWLAGWVAKLGAMFVQVIQLTPPETAPKIFEPSREVRIRELVTAAPKSKTKDSAKLAVS